MQKLMPALAVAILAAVPVAASAAPGVVAAYAGNPYVLAPACASGKPVAFVNIALKNRGKKASAPFAATATDAGGALTGNAAAPAIDPGASIALKIPLLYVLGSGVPVAGDHLITIAAGKKKLEPIVVSVPADFCTASSGPLKVGTTNVPAVKPEAARDMKVVPSGALSQRAAQRGSAIAATIKIASPVNVHAAAGGPECGAHTGLIGALVCPDMIKSGDLLLAWDWQAGAGPSAIDGYRVYRVDGGLHQLVYTQANEKDVTLVDVPKSSGAASGRCYAVSAYAGTRESAPSDAFCAGVASAAKTVALQPLHRRSSHASGGEAGNVFTGTFSEAVADDPMVVGFVYSATEHTLGDSRYYQYHRAGVVFDVAALRGRRLVSAKLHVTIATSSGEGNNHSCTTGVGTGTEFWWNNAAWLTGQFDTGAAATQNGPQISADQGAGIAPTDTGPEITADVTPIVAPWLAGEPNYGFILKNADENPGAFTNKRCLSTYIKPLLEVTYY